MEAHTIHYDLEYHADDEQISIIDFETLLVAKGLRPQPDHGESAESGGSNQIKSSMPGTIQRVAVNVGDHVKVGDLLVSMISMKNEYTFKAEKEGRVKSVRVKEG